MLLTNARLATMRSGYDLIENASVLMRGGRIIWLGQGLPPAELGAKDLTPQDCGGRLVTPGLIDCHSHAVFAGSRAGEFEARLLGKTYAEIAAQGGGILSTVRATRAADEAELLAQSLPRIDQMIRAGATTIEIKSGYGLTVEDELKMLRVARQIGQIRPVRVTTTLLAAHALPPEYASHSKYITEVALPALRLGHAEGLIDAVDAFCEGIAFSPEDLRPLFDAARAHGLPIKIHAEQLSNLEGATFAAGFGALSADHLEYLSPEGIAAMKAADMVAVILPGAFYTLREKQAPPIAALRAAGVPMALATDMNPGTSPMTALPLALNMAATLFGLTPEEALCGVTCHGARALGLSDRGQIAIGHWADLLVWDCRDPAELSYQIGGPTLISRIFGGEIAH